MTLEVLDNEAEQAIAPRSGAYPRDHPNFAPHLASSILGRLTTLKSGENVETNSVIARRARRNRPLPVPKCSQF
jgi:hypothetical protein